jgi:hypothetical protein
MNDQSLSGAKITIIIHTPVVLSVKNGIRHSFFLVDVY